MRMRKTLLLSMLMVLLSTLSIFGKTGEDPVVDNRESFNIVFLSTDTSVCHSKTVEVKEGSSLNIHQVLYIKNGYELERWESKKGLTLDKISQNDTIIAYFKLIPTYNIVVISSDTTMGTVSGSGTYLEEEKVYLNYNAKDGYILDYWYSLIDSTRFGDRIWAYRNDTVVGKFIEASAPRDTTFGMKQFNVVVLSADTTQGSVYVLPNKLRKGQPIDLIAYPNYGYAFDYWKSVNNLPLDHASGNDTIIAYFKELPKYHIVFRPNDTLKGFAHGGEGLYVEGSIMQSNWELYPQERPLIYGAFSGFHLSYWETNMGNLKTLNDYLVTKDDTITVHFEQDTIPVGCLNIYLERPDTVEFYGNIAFGYNHNFDRFTDTLFVTNKSTGKTDVFPIELQDKYQMNFGDTILLSVKTSDDYVCDSVFTLVFDDSTRRAIHKIIELSRPTQIIELENAEGDSFNVNISFVCIDHYLKGYEWDGNGVYAKGDTIHVYNEYYYYELDNDAFSNRFYRISDQEISIVVTNNIDLTLFFDFPIGVDQVVANKPVEDPYVNVYSIKGCLLKQHVLRENALDGLRKGLYIVGGKKVYVKN